MRPQKEILEIFDILSANDPAPKSELEYSNAFTLLVAIVLSAQSTDKGVNKATKELFKVADTPAKMAALGVEKLKEYIKTIGLYNNKAKNVIAMSEILVRDYGGEVPEESRKSWKVCPASATKRPTFCATYGSASRRWRSIPMFSVLPTGSISAREKPSKRWKRICSKHCRKNI